MYICCMSAAEQTVYFLFTPEKEQEALIWRLYQRKLKYFAAAQQLAALNLDLMLLHASEMHILGSRSEEQLLAIQRKKLALAGKRSKCIEKIRRLNALIHDLHSILAHQFVVAANSEPVSSECLAWC